MNRRSWKLVIVTICLGLSAGMLKAQNPCFSYSDSYAGYYEASSDGNYIYTSVTVDGQGSMTLNTGNGCSFINWSSAVHTPIAVNVISIEGASTYVGGGLSGNPECPDCYVSVTNSQSLPANSEQVYDFSAAGEVNCSFGGSIWGTNWPKFQIELAYTKSQWNGQDSPLSGGAVTCDLNAWCTPATSPPICNPGWTVQEPPTYFNTAACTPYYLTIWLAERIAGSPWACEPIIPGNNSTGTTDASKGSCTH